jgi:Nickel responsive protein SCO4226-like
MPTYLVERFLVGMTAPDVRAAAARAKLETARMTEEGTAVRYLGSTFSIEDETGFCLFEGPSREAIREANVRAAIPFERIAEVIHLTAEEVD